MSEFRTEWAFCLLSAQQTGCAGKAIMQKMARSPHTLRLWSAAHKSGDDYYRHVSDSLRNGRKLGHESAGLATVYLDALRELERHLNSLDGADEVEDLRASTAKFIDLVRGDLDRFEKTGRYELANVPPPTAD